MPDSRQKLWDTRLKLLGVLAVLGSAWWAVFVYDRNAERELRKPLWDRQLALYFEASEVTSKIATLSDNDEKRKAVQRFWQLYYGPLRVVEDNQNVGDAMKSFGRCLAEPGESSPRQTCDVLDLLDRSLQLADYCRRSIGETWNSKLGGLKAERKDQ